MVDVLFCRDGLNSTLRCQDGIRNDNIPTSAKKGIMSREWVPNKLQAHYPTNSLQV